MRILYSVAVRADLTSSTKALGQVIRERVIQSGVLVAESDEEAVYQARLAATKRYPDLIYRNVIVHVSRVPSAAFREMLARETVAPPPNTLEDHDA